METFSTGNETQWDRSRRESITDKAYVHCKKRLDIHAEHEATILSALYVLGVTKPKRIRMFARPSPTH